MVLLEAGNIKKYYGDRLIIEFDELKIFSGDKIGVIGQNGSGKTTLMNILSGEIEPDQGFIRRYCSAAYIRQFSDEAIQAEEKALKEFSIIQKAKQKVFSGGEKTRIRLANAFSGDTILLFADEPTANLDYKGIELLKAKISEVESFLLISHDRVLLDCLCNKILEVRNNHIKLYNGNYSFYKEQRYAEHKRAEKEYQKFISEKTSIEEAISDRQEKAKSMRKAPKRMGNSEARLHKRSTTQKQQKMHNVIGNLKTRLEKLEIKEKPKELPRIGLDFSLTNPPENRIVISAENLTFSYGNKQIFNNTGFNVYNGSKTALWGENGTGKSTLLNLIHDNANDGIYIVPKAKVGYLCQNFENLDHSNSVLENVMKSSVQTQTVARTILGRLLFSGDSVHKKVESLSGGEKIKVSFAKLFVSDANVLLLDEPTNYLDMQSMEALENVLRDYEGTVLFVSHDSAFVDAVADRLLVFENQVIKEYEGTLRDYKLNRQKTQNAETKEIEQIALKMRIAETVAKLSRAGADKETLEAEYQSLIKQLIQTGSR